MGLLEGKKGNGERISKLGLLNGKRATEDRVNIGVGEG